MLHLDRLPACLLHRLFPADPPIRAGLGSKNRVNYRKAETQQRRLAGAGCSVPLEHPRESSNDDGGEQPADEGEPERRPRCPALGDESVPLLEVYHRQQ